ncbi:unnamed protein product [Lactuca saligna]|uniref:Uncharacterized protein n=1 Tax=Lactuca saligna TaxID=75948 RepID=A0AA35VFT7_LACSI|nr:unnamed protein product [Lactuca saligna]
MSSIRFKLPDDESYTGNVLESLELWPCFEPSISLLQVTSIAYGVVRMFLKREEADKEHEESGVERRVRVGTYNKTCSVASMLLSSISISDGARSSLPPPNVRPLADLLLFSVDHWRPPLSSLTQDLIRSDVDHRIWCYFTKSFLSISSFRRWIYIRSVLPPLVLSSEQHKSEIAVIIATYRLNMPCVHGLLVFTKRSFENKMHTWCLMKCLNEICCELNALSYELFV